MWKAQSLSLGPLRGSVDQQSCRVQLSTAQKVFQRTTCAHGFCPSFGSAGKSGGAQAEVGEIGSDAYSAVLPAEAYVERRMEEVQRVVDALMEWLEGMLAKAPARTTPMLFMDLNDGIAYQGKDDWVAGKFGIQKENYAGQSMREVLNRHWMKAVNTHYTASATYHGNNHTSIIDYVCMPTGLEVKECVVMHRSAIALQHINTKKFLDHKPILVKFNGMLEAVKEEEKIRRWDKYALSKGLRSAVVRSKFITKIEARMAK
mmetsp:Transcript_69844/g.197902  ORF Transcript_69844/g.197902 Transcript_69844/m.197902 type:complete len:260 (-) Transcript_69844:2493-3272(-)